MRLVYENISRLASLKLVVQGIEVASIIVQYSVRKNYLICFCTGTVLVSLTSVCRLPHQRQRLLLGRKVEAVEEKGSLMLI